MHAARVPRRPGTRLTRCNRARLRPAPTMLALTVAGHLAEAATPSSQANGGGGDPAPCSTAFLNKVHTLIRRPSMGSSVSIGSSSTEDSEPRAQSLGASQRPPPLLNKPAVREALQHLDPHWYDLSLSRNSNNASEWRARFDDLLAPLVYLQLYADAQHLLNHLPLTPPTRHRPAVVVIALGQSNLFRRKTLRSRLRSAGYLQHCLVGPALPHTRGASMVAINSCPMPATEGRFNRLVGGLFDESLVPAGAVLDAGANTGEFACFYAGLDTRREVHALDAGPQYVDRIRNHYAPPRIPNLQAELRGLGSRTRLMNRRGGKGKGERSAAGGSASTMPPLCVGGAGHLLPTARDLSEVRAVPVCRVDDLYALQPLGFAHWDVEGSELDVLQGARAVVRRDRPLFSVEVHVHEDTAYTSLLLKTVRELGYDAHLVEERCGARADCRNFLCTPVELRDRLRDSPTMRLAASERWILPANDSSIASLAYPCCVKGGACPNCSPSEVDAWLGAQVRAWESNGRSAALDPRALYTDSPWDRTTNVSQMDVWAAEYTNNGGNRLAQVAGSAGGDITPEEPEAKAAAVNGKCSADATAARRLFGLPFAQRPASWMPIFFLHISPLTSLRPLEDCVIRTAARLNPDLEVLVVSNSLQKSSGDGDNDDGGSTSSFLLFPSDPSMRALRFPPRCVRLQYETALEGTVLLPWYQLHGHNESIEHLPVILADVLRLALLYHVGGAYLDLDMLLVAPLPQGPEREHSVAMQLQGRNLTKGWRTMWELNNAALLFGCARSPILPAIMGAFVRKYEPWVWGTGGPVLFTRVWKGWRDRNVSAYSSLAALNVLPHSTFYPIHWWDRKYFDKPEWDGAADVIKPGITIGVHLWNKVYNNASSRPWVRNSYAARFVRGQCRGWAPTHGQ